MEQLANTLKALGDPTRLRILHLLTHGEMCVCDLMAGLALPQSTVSRHLSYLKNAGWLTSRRAGVWMHYMLTDASPHRELLGTLAPHMRAMCGEDLSRLEHHLATKDEAC